MHPSLWIKSGCPKDWQYWGVKEGTVSATKTGTSPSQCFRVGQQIRRSLQVSVNLSLLAFKNAHVYYEDLNQCFCFWETKRIPCFPSSKLLVFPSSRAIETTDVPSKTSTTVPLCLEKRRREIQNISLWRGGKRHCKTLGLSKSIGFVKD